MTRPAPPVSRSRRGRRGSALRRAAAAALAAAVTAASAAAPAAAQQDSGAYDDVASDAHYSAAVAALARDGVFDGTDCDNGFCPDQPIDRATMAVWLVRILDDTEPPAATGERFTDVATDHPHSAHIERLAELKVTIGCADGTYCPNDPVTRAQMAVFLTRALKLPEPPTAARTFTDVAADHPFAGHIATLAASRITAGCGDGTQYCPNDPVTRAQMAVFVARGTGRVPKPDPPSTPTQLWVAYLTRDGQLKIATNPTAQTIWTDLNPQPDDDFTYPNFFVQPSPDGAHIAARTSSYDSTGLWVAAADGTTPTQLANEYGDGDIVFGWSPDGEHIAYQTDPLGNNTFLVAAADGTTDPTQLTNNLDFYGDFKWSPDGAHIAYQTFTWDVEDDGRALSVAAADGTTDPIQLTNNLYDDYFEWSPDGAHIAYQTRTRDSDSGNYSRGLWVAAADGTTPTQLTNNLTGWDNSYSFGWSPDGAHIVYQTRTRDSDSGNYSRGLWVAAADGTTPTQLTNNLNDRDFGWSPDGAHIAYQTQTGSFGSYSYGLWVAAADGTTDPTQLTNNNVYGFNNLNRFGWSPDGAHIAYQTRTRDSGNYSYSFWVAAADGTTDPTQLTNNNVYGFRWSPDGAHIAYPFRPSRIVVDSFGISYRQYDSRGLWVAAADGTTDPTQLTNNLNRENNSSSGDGSFGWSPDGAHIAYAEEDPAEGPNGSTVLRIAGIEALDDPTTTGAAHPAKDGPSSVTNFPEIGLSWSPDGARILYSLYYPPSGDVFDAWRSTDYFIAEADGSATTELEAAQRYAWSPDGTKFASSIRTEPLVPVAFDEFVMGFRLLVGEADGSNMMPLGFSFSGIDEAQVPDYEIEYGTACGSPSADFWWSPAGDYILVAFAPEEDSDCL